MAVEIEAKLKVGSLEEIAARLPKVGAEFIEEQLQRDFYFDDAQRSMTASDTCLRIRQQLAGSTEKIFLTFKGPREKGLFKRRQEIEIEVSDLESTKALLSALGYEEALIVEKKRRLWRLGECGVVLDELALLGSFVEIEGPDESKIAGIQKKLGLETLPHIRQSYATLVAEKLNQKSTESQL